MAAKKQEEVVPEPEEGEEQQPPAPQGIVVTDPPASEGAPADQPQPSRAFTAEDIERARQQEKDKLYSQLEEQKAKIAELAEAEEARRRVEAEERERLEAESRRLAEEEMSVRELLEHKEKEWQEQLAAERQERENLAATLNREREYQQLQDYRTRRLTEEVDTIMPELRDLVGGNTQAEIDASIDLVKSKTEAIMQQVAANMPQPVQAPPRGASVTGQPPVGPQEMLEGSQRQLTPEDIANMPMEEYKRLRGQLMEAAGGRGPYG